MRAERAQIVRAEIVRCLVEGCHGMTFLSYCFAWTMVHYRRTSFQVHCVKYAEAEYANCDNPSCCDYLASEDPRHVHSITSSSIQARYYLSYARDDLSHGRLVENLGSQPAISGYNPHVAQAVVSMLRL